MYHFVFVAKYRRLVMKEEVDTLDLDIIYRLHGPNVKFFMSQSSISIQNLAFDKALQSAMDDFNKSKKDTHYNNPFWSLGFYWQSTKKFLKKSLLAGTYFLKPIRQWAARKMGDRPASQYDPQDAVVLKTLTALVKKHLSPLLSKRCTHLEGHGGQKGAVRQIHEAIKSGKYKFVFRTDVKSYYDSINNDILMNMLREHINEYASRAYYGPEDFRFITSIYS